jgi:flagellar biosynthesis/type III secretory pathway protein FliH
MKRFTRRAVFAFVLVAAAAGGFSSSAFAQYGYYDDYYDRGYAQQARNYGFQSGYHDGFRKGRHEGRENDPGDINVRALQEATHGYRSWMGPVEAFRDGYRDGYHRGFRRGYEAGNRGWRDRDYDDGYRW